MDGYYIIVCFDNRHELTLHRQENSYLYAGQLVNVPATYRAVICVNDGRRYESRAFSAKEAYKRVWSLVRRSNAAGWKRDKRGHLVML